MSVSRRKKTVAVPSAKQDRLITAAALSDPDARPLTRGQLGAMVPFKRLRGRPPLANRKLLVSIRYSPEVLDYFRGTGEGWQSRMDAVLKEYVDRRSRKAASRA